MCSGVFWEDVSSGLLLPIFSSLQMLFKKNLFEMAINLAKSQHLDSDGLAQIFMQYGDHLYSKGNHDGAVQQYIRSVGGQVDGLEPSLRGRGGHHGEPSFFLRSCDALSEVTVFLIGKGVFRVKYYMTSMRVS